MRLFRSSAIALAMLAALPAIAPLACAVPDNASISPFDADRMDGLGIARTRGLAEALRAESAADRELVSLLFAPGIAPQAPVPDGNYRCRTIKLGGLLPLTAYSYFDCVVAQGGTKIEKLTGSQRFSGDLLATDAGGHFYRGALHYGDEDPRPYQEEGDRSQVGCLYKVDGKPVRYRLELPFPRFESTHDVIELVPAR
ncbi:hypothetical protein GGR20_002074 [Devosia subaequoris]|uniref:DUF4893 domain-containing protein n=1 Tax=Devosia subaequoris TaxID=395930 RepID=A0A7W6INL6_9HYPH|nr:DUF4893 domain-containing protein [Devosia subaequoris]MBB4052431.1 hypothetical protein [Devosia subaequoris]MCP1209591.1 DUF4893 domain-containing protein [Devosia subaequoris]